MAAHLPPAQPAPQGQPHQPHPPPVALPLALQLHLLPVAEFLCPPPPNRGGTTLKAILVCHH
ncbi:hypothetical protein E2C01_041901 [Portunus trituberculatus]|uniref:Uncharacterized protein n=1 Tax=Portunus trituberculatus TaxID=210409 RepID=A0A5B7FRX8_PORTR|nr:hypothetical protein [Portunus trituberculatus]